MQAGLHAAALPAICADKQLPVVQAHNLPLQRCTMPDGHHCPHSACTGATSYVKLIEHMAPSKGSNSSE